MPKEIIIDIGIDGKVRIEANGFVDAECKQLTKDLEAALGTTTNVVQKPEFHRRHVNVNKQTR